MSKKFLVWVIIIFAIFAAFSLAACTDNYGRPSDYVEVEKLSIESANIYLSPAGVTSTYQLDVKILPTTASNTKLIYYVPSEYMQYLLVSDSGLLSATGQMPPEGTIIPVKISSTTNKKASLTVNVIIENAAVKEIGFEKSEVMLYLNETYQLTPIYTPYHAQDGRSVTYTSLTEDVATVNSDGLIEPVKVGSATIICVGSLSSGKTVTGRIRVKVVYSPGRYRLEVTDSNPQYNQVLGDFKPIHFNLLSLEPNSNPNIRILWYVNDKNVKGLGTDSRQYEHVPNVENRTSYKIKVVVEPETSSENDPQQIFYSDTISIYEKFNGFDLTFGNLIANSSDTYKYGDVIEFPLVLGDSSIDHYNWYLRKQGELGIGTKIAETKDPDRNLTRRLNVEGNYILSAHAIKKDNSDYIANEFRFSVTRFIAGDALVITPKILNDGNPPENYNYSIARCDDKGNLLETPIPIGNSSEGKSFNYTVNEPGNYILSANATLNGVIATVMQTIDGKNTPVEYVYRSDVLRFFATTDDSARPNDLVSRFKNSEYTVKNTQEISDVTISGICDEGVYKVLLRWDAPLGIEDYCIEITNDSKGKEVTVFSSGFGNRYFIVPYSTATLEDTFSVRIKSNGSLYSERYYYNYGLSADKTNRFDAVPAEAHPYLAPLSGITTRYVRSMKEVGDLLRYLIDYNPNPNNTEGITNKVINGVRTITFDLMFGFDLSDALLYDCNDGNAAHKALVGAQSAYCAPDTYIFTANPIGDGGYAVSISRPSNTTVSPSELNFPDGTVSASYSKTPYGEEKSSHKIDSRKASPTETSEQLYYAVLNGYKPEFISDGSIAETIYLKALDIINGIIGEEMTEYEKVLAIFDYLTLNVKYDEELAESAETDDADPYSASFRLEGVFLYNTAVCDGISKAFVLLCAIEGIRAERITGLIDGKTHAWNKVCVNGSYYVVDCTNGALATENGNVTNHKYFMLSDEDYAELFDEHKEYGINKTCESTVDYYSKFLNEIRLTVTTKDELTALLNETAIGTNPVAVCFKIDKSLSEGVDSLSEFISSVNLTNGKIVSVTVFSDGERVSVILFK